MSNTSIFEKRVNFKPFEYPQAIEFADQINKTFWTHSEVNFTSDVQDFNTNFKPHEKEIIKRALLGISQVEVAVKLFWGNLYNHFPKPEMNILGATFAHNEAIHSLSYSHLLEILGYNNEFEKLLDIPIFKEKIALNEEGLSNNKSILEKLLFFTLIIENASLFSQFATILSFTRFRGQLKNTSNIIAWTSADEQLHANTGIWLINTIKEEKATLLGSEIPFVDDTFIDLIKRYVEIEERFIDWIYEGGELEFFTIKDLKNFMKARIDDALSQIGLSKIYNISSEELKPMLWFEEEVFANSLDDFFAKRPVDYTKHDKSITKDDLF